MVTIGTIVSPCVEVVRRVKQDTHAYLQSGSLIFRDFVFFSYEHLCSSWAAVGGRDDI
jgi:hypothetical protein